MQSKLDLELVGLTKRYGAQLLISEHTYRQLENPDAYHLRTLGRVLPKGKSTPVTIYELFDGNPAEHVDRKLATRSAFETALSLYRQGRFDDAMASFEGVLVRHPDDSAARVYVDRCAYYLRQGRPHDWDGVERFDSK